MVQTVVQKASTRCFQKVDAFKIAIGNTIDATVRRISRPYHALT